MAAGSLGDIEGDGRASEAQPKQNVAEVMNISRGWVKRGFRAGHSALQYTLAGCSIKLR